VWSQDPGPPTCVIVSFRLSDGIWIAENARGVTNTPLISFEGVLFVADWPQE
jgi:hypothetical protein